MVCGVYCDVEQCAHYEHSYDSFKVTIHYMLSPQRTVVRGHCWHGAASNLVGECRVIGMGSKTFHYY